MQKVIPLLILESAVLIPLLILSDVLFKHHEVLEGVGSACVAIFGLVYLTVYGLHWQRQIKEREAAEFWAKFAESVRVDGDSR